MLTLQRGSKSRAGLWRTALTGMTLLCLLLFKPVSAASYQMDFPVKLNQVEVAQVSAALTGFELESISADEFRQKMNHLLSKEVNGWLLEQGQQALTPDQYKKQGIVLTLQPQDLVIELSLSESAMAIDSLSYEQAEHVVLPTQTANWALLSQLNLNHQRSNNNQAYNSAFEGLFDANIGGGTGINGHASLFWTQSHNENSQFYRGDVRLFYDQVETPLRITLGDTQSRSSGHLSGYQLGGLSLDKAYAQLQPQRNLSPGNSQVFVLERAASIEIYVNDFMVSRVRLRAGRYDVNDLPLTSGSNKIRLVVTYNNGDTDQFDFTSHYNAQLLAAGISDYSVALGYLSSIDRNVYHYGDELLLSGMYEYGISDALTLGVNGATHPLGHVGGGTLTTGNRWGNLSLRYSLSKSKQRSGHIYSLETEHSIWGQSNYGYPNLRLGYEKNKNFSSSPWLVQSTEPHDSERSKRVYIDYSYYVDDNIDFNLYGSVLFKPDAQQNEDLTAQLNWRYQGLNMSLGYSLSLVNEPDRNRTEQYYLNFTWSLFDPVNNTRQRLRYNKQSKVLSASHDKINTNYLNDYGYQLLAEKGEQYRREQLKASYTSRLLRADVTADNFSRNGQRAQSGTSINLSSSVGVADGYVGVGTNVSAPFAVVAKHKTLTGSDVLINVNRANKPQTKTGDDLGALVNLGTGYNLSQFSVDVPKAPFGYDWGPGTYRLAGGASTGHYFQIGSALSYTVLGVLQDNKGQPMSLQRGKVVQLNDQVECAEPACVPQTYSLFTNRTGRFVIEGIGAGKYRVQLKEGSGYFEVKESTQRFVKLGTIILSDNPK